MSFLLFLIHFRIRYNLCNVIDTETEKKQNKNWFPKVSVTSLT